ncbi:D-alanyl-D-alanine carboxypeptidase (penicillin-binding protein 5/6) [Natranaerovirga hydrolytica]|uniref:serine-type D-Ala-D-Ala carboxypeptidase n=1 Tax=Natranaerovirga hydrolytica TaxID=680378 RepID=A0A4R1MZE4_9FIRM|nr:D-alanyl-D-alanine carboxypeptidase family protein [Natranaerovirga hydrolytica]TCK97980.1 D-alanyl-D-alanine carboxypeptidase (penicillin-binding protein 5/6) [Natranaerovirga hydrolytica]
MKSFYNRTVKIVIAILLIIVSLNHIILAEEDITNLYAHAAILIDGNNGRILWENNGMEQRSMASTTKIMTAMIALEYGNLEEEVVVSKKASLAPEVKLHIREGEKYKLGDLLYALMLESSNDVAIAIAEHVGGSVEDFCEMMTVKAHTIGAVNTSYKTPNGLDAEGHFSTAYDLALIARYALENDEFRALINTRQKEFFELTNNRHIMVHNKNAFLDMMDGAIGVKTGFTNQAGYCFVGAVEKDDQYFISVVLAAGWPPHRSYKWQDTRKIMAYGIHNYEYKEIIEEKIMIEPLNVIDGKEEKVKVELNHQLGLLLKEEEIVNQKLVVPTSISAPIQENVTIGYLNVYIDNELYAMLPVKTVEAVEKIDFRFCLDIILEMFLL